jgi:hypothetical protein
MHAFDKPYRRNFASSHIDTPVPPTVPTIFHAEKGKFARSSRGRELCVLKRLLSRESSRVARGRATAPDKCSSIISQAVHHPNSGYMSGQLAHSARTGLLQDLCIRPWRPLHLSTATPVALLPFFVPMQESLDLVLWLRVVSFLSAVCLCVFGLAAAVSSRRRSDSKRTKTGISACPPVYTGCPKTFDFVWISRSLSGVTFASQTIFGVSFFFFFFF